MANSPTPLAFARGLAEYLSHVRPTSRSMKAAKKFVRRRRDLRGEPLDRKGYEYVVERFLRQGITRYARTTLRIPKGELHQRVYSSHFHTTSDREAVWKTRWEEFSRAHPDVDTDDNGHSRRADLFISMGKDLVSIEFKYVRPNSKPAAQACVNQILQHLEGHGACALVLYVATPQSAKLASAKEVIREALRRERGFVVEMAGPSISFP